ncbi:GAF domain-containing protein [Amnibacterium sp. CER49]|uniref:GAF domain-containing protein n=1 Tax=Amnibacterium sp. CER49 TaxID=3039161 RepID=UPI00244A7A12|nr:GAF domain-containing protein [Amnibacterium sp. CER49]MDH2443520.1 GAF domain-containing protein [Amnibacterium sp. CER49]
MPDMGYRAEAMSRGAAQRIQGLAGDLAAVMTPALNGVSARGLATSPRSARGIIEAGQDRQAALDELALRRERNPRIDQLTRMAKLAFGTRYAAVTLIDGESQWYKSAINLPDRVIPRSLALCARTVQQDDALVIEDLTTDPRSPAPMLEYGVRFYAGVPIESRDGYRVGALCVLDDQPHAAQDFDLRLLQHFAIEIQRELWQEAAAVE